MSDDPMAGMTINERVKYRYQVLGQTENQIAQAENRSLQTICNIRMNGYPPNKTRQIYNKRDESKGTRLCIRCNATKPIKEFYRTDSYCKLCRADYNIQYNYDLTPEQHQQMVIDQDNKCLICEYDMEDKSCVDHIHDTKYVRGLLCYACNTALGKFRDSPRLLLRAIRYLQWNEARHMP